MTTKHFKAYSIPLADPWDFTSDDPIADAIQVYGEIELDDPPDDCDLSPEGYHVFNCVIEPERCIYCGRRI